MRITEGRRGTLTRRAVLAGLGSAAASAALGTASGSGMAAAAPAPWWRVPDPGAFDYLIKNMHGGLIVTDLEILTVTDSSVTFAWSSFAGPHTGIGPMVRTTPTDAQVWLATSDAPLRLVHHDRTRRGLHQVTVSGLQPGSRYRFECRSAGRKASPGYIATGVAWADERRGEFTTLTPPPGHQLGAIAILNDTHIGEEKAGLIIGDFPPAITAAPGSLPYPEVALSAALHHLRRHRPDWLIVNGDCTSEARPAEVRRFRDLMNGYGQYGVDWHVTRGNHDRPHRSQSPNDEYAPAPPLRGSGDGHRDAWGAEFVARQQLWTHRVGELRILGIDSTQLDGSGGEISAAQMRAIGAELRSDPRRPTVVFAHHPVTRDTRYTNMSGPSFVLNERDSDELQHLLAATPGVFFMGAGHTHRTRRDSPDTARKVDFLETVSTKDYPGGYTLLTLYTGGYMINTIRPDDPAMLEWAARARWAALGIHPEYTFGVAADRNYVRRIDLSALG